MRAIIIALVAIAMVGFGSTAFADDRDQLRIQDRLQDRDQLHLCTASTSALMLSASPLQTRSWFQAQNQLRIRNWQT